MRTRTIIVEVVRVEPGDHHSLKPVSVNDRYQDILDVYDVGCWIQGNVLIYDDGLRDASGYDRSTLPNV